MTIRTVELDISKPLAVVFVCSERKENLKKQSEQVRAKVEEQGYQVVEEFQALTFPKEANRDKVFLEVFQYLFNNREIVQTLALLTDRVLGEDTLSESLLSLLRNHLGVDLIIAIDEDF